MVRTVIRAPNHLGDFVMALPALNAVRPDSVILPRWLAPLGEFAGFHVIAFDRGIRGFAAAVATLRRHRFERGVLLTPSFSSAVMFRLAGVRGRRGTDTDARGFLLNARVDRELLALHHRSTAYMILATGDVPSERPTPSLEVAPEMRARFRALIGTQAPLIGIFPGSNAPSRTWFQDRFAAVAKTLSADARVVVFGGQAEAEKTRVVAGDVGLDLGGKTDLPMLAAGLAECGVVICNDTGPLHLAAAVGARTISLWGAGNPAESAPPAAHIVLRDTRLPCLECVKNVCPRTGKGFFLTDAHMECMQLIDTTQVIEAARSGDAGLTA